MPNISMDIKARYVTQSSVYGTGYCGPLTDKKIAKYQKQGYYGGSTVRQDAKKKTRSKRVKVTVDVADYI